MTLCLNLTIMLYLDAIVNILSVIMLSFDILSVAMLSAIIPMVSCY
jgi:hypothetical protein